MPKGKKGKGKGKKGKKGKKVKKEEPQPPPLHDLTKLYNQLVEEVEEFNASRNQARKKRIEAWYMTREMMNLRHDKEIYNKHLEEKMEDLENLFSELTRQLEEEREAVERIIKQRMEEMDRIISSYKERSTKAEATLQQLKTSLLEFEPMMRELAGLMAKLKELQALIPVYELEANIKTRHLKNQYLLERSKLHNHLESELYKLITTCRSHLMPILADHMTSMELENRCNRWEVGVLDEKNFRLYRERENLLEKRNHLNMEREYLTIDWAFNKLAQMEARKKDQRTVLKVKKKSEDLEEECELAIAFRSYLSTKLGDIERAKERERRAKATREARERRLKREQEKKRRAEILAKKREEAKTGKLKKKVLGTDTDEEEIEDELDEWGELEYYEDDEGNWVIATPSRMLQHKAILENKAMDEVEKQVEDIKKTISKKKRDMDRDDYDEGSGSSSSSGHSSGSSGSSSWSGESEGSLASLTDLDDDDDDNYEDDDDGGNKKKKDKKKKKKKQKPQQQQSEYGYGDYNDDDDFGDFD